MADETDNDSGNSSDVELGAEEDIENPDYEFTPVPTQVVYSDQDRAVERAQDLGLDGVHTHTVDGQDHFMAGATHRDWLDALEKDSEEDMDDTMTEEDDGSSEMEEESQELSSHSEMAEALAEMPEDDFDEVMMKTHELRRHGRQPDEESSLSEEDGEEGDAQQVFHADQERNYEDLEDDNGTRVDPHVIQRVADAKKKVDE